MINRPHNAKAHLYIGQTFNRLTVLAVAPSRKHKSYLTVQCECGSVKTVQTASVIGGKTKSCGCLLADHCKAMSKQGAAASALVTKGRIPKTRLKYGEAAFRRLVARYKRNAKARGYEWSLSDAEARQLMNGNCVYCGTEPTRVSKGGTGTYGTVVCNGIDRVDNSKSYTPDNVVSCCTTCNWYKREFTVDVFLTHVEKIHLEQQRVKTHTAPTS